mgnify:CR=1 FL=1
MFGLIRLVDNYMKLLVTGKHSLPIIQSRDININSWIILMENKILFYGYRANF